MIPSLQVRTQWWFSRYRLPDHYRSYRKVFEETKMLESTVDLVKRARALGDQVIEVYEGYSPDYRELDWSNPGYVHRNQILRQAWKIGSQAVELYEPLRPGPMDKDILLPNRITVSGFGNNALDTRALSTTTNFCKWSKDIRRGKTRWIDEYSFAVYAGTGALSLCLSNARQVPLETPPTEDYHRPLRPPWNHG